LGEALGQEADSSSVSQALLDYANARLQALEQTQSWCDHSSEKQVSILWKIVRHWDVPTQANRYTAQYLTTVSSRALADPPVEKISSLLNGLLLGMA